MEIQYLGLGDLLVIASEVRCRRCTWCDLSGSADSERRAANFLISRFDEIHRQKKKRGAGFESPLLDAVREALATPHWAGQIPGSVPPSADP